MARKLTLCWSCVNAVPNKEHGCCWSRSARPVPGWTANPNHVAGNGRDYDSYHVEACPEFVRDSPEEKICENPNDVERHRYQLQAIDKGLTFGNSSEAARWLIKNGLNRKRKYLTDSLNHKCNMMIGDEFEAYGVRWKAKAVSMDYNMPRGSGIRCVTADLDFASITKAAEWIKANEKTDRNISAIANTLRYHATKKDAGKIFSYNGLKWRMIGK